MDTTAPNTNVNTHTFFLPLKISRTRTFTREQTYRLNLLSVQTLGLKVVSTHRDGYCGMYVGQSVIENTKLRSLLLQS